MQTHKQIYLSEDGGGIWRRGERGGEHSIKEIPIHPETCSFSVEDKGYFIKESLLRSTTIIIILKKSQELERAKQEN